MKKKIIILAILCLSTVAAGIILSSTKKEYSSNYKVEIGQKSTEDSYFPQKIDSAGLEITSIGSYDGIYVENGVDDEVTGVMAMMVKNTSGKFIEYSTIEVNADGQNYHFEISCLPPEQNLLALEINQASFTQHQTYEIGECLSAYKEAVSLHEETVEITAMDDTLTFTNLTDHDLYNIRVCYKNKQKNNYLGGITYRLSVDILPAGKSVSKRSGHFNSNSEIIYIDYEQ